MQKEKSRQVAKQLLTACIADMFPALHWVTVIYINIFFFPLTFLLDEPSVLKFGTAVNKVLLFVLTLFLQEESRFFWLHKQDCAAFADAK